MFPWPLYGYSLDLIDDAVGVIDEFLNPRETTELTKSNGALKCKTVL